MSTINKAVKVHAEMQKTESDFIFEKRLIEGIFSFFLRFLDFIFYL
jgi:hypothetical protein